MGNARVTYSDANNDGFITVADIKQINHYYPFGMNMEGNWNGAAGSNKYQYNGKEWNDDFGLGLNDYGARFYDPAIGRWNAVDPLTENNPNLSPYRYCFNNPVRFIDPNGLYEVDGHYWTVYLAATVLGLSNAKDLAFYAQAPDEIMSDDGDIMSATNTWIYPKYQSSIHALTGNTAAFERFRSADWALNARGNIETGVALHRLGDSYAHSFLYWGKELMYPNGQGHLFEGHDPDKISKRPELYLKYVNNLIDILGTKFGTSRVADMFAFIYVAYTGLDTDGNSAIFETEINIRKGNQPLQVSGNQSGVINNYISARNKHYHSNTKIKTLVTEKETYTRDKKGNWQRSYGTVTLVGFED